MILTTDKRNNSKIIIAGTKVRKGLIRFQDSWTDNIKRKSIIWNREKETKKNNLSYSLVKSMHKNQSGIILNIPRLLNICSKTAINIINIRRIFMTPYKLI
jgi:hypothetical protein